MVCDNEMQTRLLCALAADPEFFEQNVNKLRLSDFPSVTVRLLFETLRAHWRKYGRLPTSRVFPEEMKNSMRGIGPDGQESITTSVPATLVSAVAAGIGSVFKALKEPDNRDTAYFRDRLKEYLSTVRLSAMPGQDMNATEQLEAAAQIKAEVDQITGGGKKGKSTSARKRVVMKRQMLPPKFGTGIWPIDIRMNRGLELGELGCVLAGSGVGKALVNSDLIPTPSGLRRVDEIKPGDLLFGHDGKPVKVLMVHPQPSKKKVWIVKFSDGRETRCCGDHNWEYWYECHKGWVPRVETTRTIYERAGKLGGLKRKGGQAFRYKIRLAKAVEYPEAKLPVDPYVIGVSIGNGCLSQWQFSISSGTPEVPEKVASILGVKAVRKCQNNYSYIFETESGHHLQNREVLTGSCAEYLLGRHSHDKSIPPEYLTASITQRMRLLCGLMDTDGSIDGVKGRVRYTTTSPKLAEDVRQLCMSLGMTATFTMDNRTDYKSGECYNVHIQCPKSLKPELFTESSKHARAVAYANNGKREEFKQFTAITDIVETDEYEDMTCFTVDSPEGLFLCKDFVVTHNTNILVNVAANSALRGQRSLFLTLELSEEVILRRLHAMMGNFPMSLMGTPEEEWPKSDLARYDWMLSDSFPNIDYVTINSEYVDKTPTCEDLDREIADWRESLEKQGIGPEQAPFVLVDYIRQIDPGKLSTKNDNTNTKYGAIMQSLKRLAMKYHCVIWTAQQVTRAANRKEHIRKDDIADSIAIVNHCDAVLGFVPVGDHGNDAPTTEESEDDTVSNHADKERQMNVDFVKLRNAGETGSFCTVFQNRSLRLWTAEPYAQVVEKLAKSGDYERFFSVMKPKEPTYEGKKGG